MIKKFNMAYRIFIVLMLSVVNTGVFAEGLYLQTLNKTVLNAEQIQKSKQKIEEHKSVTVREKLAIEPFHKRGQINSSLEYSVCTGCHLSPPHTKSDRTRTFMNMHTQFIACETCHFRPENTELNYQWEDVREGKMLPAKQELFRQVVIPEEKPEERIKTLHSVNKITPFYQKEAVVLRKNSAFAQETVRIWMDGSLEAKAKRRALIHAPLQKEGPECQACHDKQQNFLNLTGLGATTYQIEKIQNNIIAQFFARYKDKEQRIRIMSILQ